MSNNGIVDENIIHLVRKFLSSKGKHLVPDYDLVRIENGSIQITDGHTYALIQDTAIPDMIISKIRFIKVFSESWERVTVNDKFVEFGREKTKLKIEIAKIEKNFVIPDNVTKYKISKEIVGYLKTMYKIIGEDYTRPWAACVLCRGTSMYATNNVSIVEVFSGITFPHDIIISRTLINKLDEEDAVLFISENQIGFEQGNIMLFESLVADKWPNLNGIFQQWKQPEHKTKVEDLMSHLVFSDNIDEEIIKLNEEGMTYGKAQSVYTTDEIRGEGLLRPKFLNGISTICDVIDLTTYPSYSLVGPKARGIVLGTVNTNETDK